MLCPFCGSYAKDDELVCPRCAKVLPRPENRDTGVRAIRQGKRARQAYAEGRSPIAQAQQEPLSATRQGQRRAWVDPQTHRFENGAIPVYSDPEVYNEEGDPVSTSGFDRRRRTAWVEQQSAGGAVNPTPRSRQHLKKRERRINMAWLTIWLTAGLLAVVLGVYLFFTRTGDGQVILARYGREATSAAYWQVGSERFDTGDIDGAIADFEHAAALDAAEETEAEVNVPGLIMLASCYEAAGRTEDAEAMYTWLYTDVVPSATDAYTAEIRILLNSGRRAEAAELMLLAYEKTGVDAFAKQHTELVPAVPIVNYTAGSYEYKLTMSLVSAENYDIYYTFDEEAQLPQDGTLYSGRFELDEGVWRMRAVCVNGDLVSNELTGTYRISMPSPQQPYAHLAPNTYTTRRTVALSPGIDNRRGPREEYSKEKDITIYYTIDGSIPDSDSPVYNPDEPVRLGTGWVVLHAIAVNGYGKASNTLEVTYKIDVRPWPKEAYTTQDLCNSVKLNTTGWDEFRSLYGDPERAEDVSLSGLNDCRRRYYPWGYATFNRSGSAQFLVELYFTGTLTGPRNTKIGDTENAIVGQFRDCSQVESPSGNRGLYSNSDGTGKIYREQDGRKTIRYVAYTADSHYWRLDYNLSTGGVCDSIYMLFIP